MSFSEIFPFSWNCRIDSATMPLVIDQRFYARRRNITRSTLVSTLRCCKAAKVSAAIRSDWSKPQRRSDTLLIETEIDRPLLSIRATFNNGRGNGRLPRSTPHDVRRARGVTSDHLVARQYS
jgi:hypothetical protein